MDLELRITNCLKQSMLQAGVDSYVIDAIATNIVQDILTVLREYKNDQE